jgi:hypothetical protein
MFKSFVVLSALALSTAAYAADGKAEFRIAGGAHVSFEYEADLAGGKITGTVERGGFNRVEITAGRGGAWTGTVGGTGIETGEIQGDENGVRRLTVRTMQGIFSYSIQKNRRGDIEFRAVGPRTGSLLMHVVTEKGAFSVSTPLLDMEVTRDADEPTHFEGIVVSHFDTDYAELVAEGTLDPQRLAKSDPALFVLLYLLPFDAGN